jgi:bacterioferritin-associated ferredoxin
LLICHCVRVCDRDIRECVRAGARTTDDVGRSCGAGTRCGGCREAIESIVQRESADEDEGLVMPLLSLMVRT